MRPAAAYMICILKPVCNMGWGGVEHLLMSDQLGISNMKNVNSVRM